jgi:hypothetical protein
MVKEIARLLSFVGRKKKHFACQPTFVGRKKKYFDGLPTFAERKKSTLTACRHLLDVGTGRAPSLLIKRQWDGTGDFIFETKARPVPTD